jgi:hypothetical protein
LNLSCQAVRDAFLGTATGTGMIFMIVLGAGLQRLPRAHAVAAIGGVLARRAANRPLLVIAAVLLA